MTREEIIAESERKLLHIEVVTCVKMMKETAKVLCQLDMEATSKILNNQAERTLRKLNEVIPA